MSDFTRVNKYLAHATGLSRREADNAVTSGRVTINGVKAQLGSHIEPTDVVSLDGKSLAVQTDYTYVQLHKPTGYVCSRKRQGETPTIYELLPPQFRALKPVGRLDKDSSGLILLTDDGDFAHRMTHPKFTKIKTYEVELDKPLAPLHQQMVSDHGISLEDGVSKLLVEKMDRSSESVVLGNELPPHRSESQDPKTKNYAYKVTMSEGRNRQIRRTFAALGYTVTRLHRTSFGPYTLTDMPVGDSKIVTQL